MKFDGLFSGLTAVTEPRLMDWLPAMQTGEGALTAGVDREMSAAFNQNGAELLKDGKLSQATIDQAVRRPAHQFRSVV